MIERREEEWTQKNEGGKEQESVRRRGQGKGRKGKKETRGIKPRQEIKGKLEFFGGQGERRAEKKTRKGKQRGEKNVQRRDE